MFVMFFLQVNYIYTLSRILIYIYNTTTGFSVSVLTQLITFILAIDVLLIMWYPISSLQQSSNQRYVIDVGYSLLHAERNILKYKISPR